MMKGNGVVVALVAGLVAAGASGVMPPVDAQGTTAPTLEQIVKLERAALDRWVRLDPQGYLDLYSPEVTYFDPQREKRIDGLEAMKTLLGPIKNMKPPFTNPRYDMIAPRLQVHGDTALLTFNLVSYGTPAGGKEIVVARWNSSELYARVSGVWKIVHSHWSLTKPELKQQAPR
jgi:ketosteroid isomerase-like protein